MKSLDNVFSKFIRLRDSGKSCISCHRLVTLETSDAGHYITRGNLALRFDERNVNAQCVECNRFKDGNIKGYERGLMRKYGHNIIEELNIKKYKCSKLSKRELSEMAALYRKKIKNYVEY